MKLTQWDSITGSSIAVGNVCHVRQPRLSEVRQLGYDKFFGYVSVIMFDPSELDGQIPMLIPDLSTFYILITYPMLRETFFEALSFFIEEEVLILTKDKALSAKNQEVIIDDGGYLGRLRKTQKDAQGMDALDADGNPIFLTDSQGNPIYDGEQLRIVNNCIVFTDDGWETAKTAVGKLYLGKDKSGNDVYKYGVAGDVIIGKIIAGNNLIIAERIKHEHSYVYRTR